jgi:MFS family permease
MSAFVMLEAVFAIFCNDRFGFEELQVGGFFAFVGLIIIIVQGGLVGRLTRRFGEWNLLISGAIGVAVAMGLYVHVGANASIAVTGGVILILLAGLFNATGRSILTPTLSALISQFTDPRRQGATFGLYHMLGSLARVIGPVIATALYAHYMTGPFALAGLIVLLVAAWVALLRAKLAANAATPVAESRLETSAGHE